MSEKNYSTVTGIIQFDPTEREVNGKMIREVLIRAVGSGKNVRVTVWDNYAGIPLKKGDAIYADGEAKQNTVQKEDGSSVTYNNLSCASLVYIPGAAKVEQTRVVNQTSTQPDMDQLF